MVEHRALPGRGTSVPIPPCRFLMLATDIEASTPEHACVFKCLLVKWGSAHTYSSTSLTYRWIQSVSNYHSDYGFITNQFRPKKLLLLWRHSTLPPSLQPSLLWQTLKSFMANQISVPNSWLNKFWSTLIVQCLFLKHKVHTVVFLNTYRNL